MNLTLSRDHADSNCTLGLMLVEDLMLDTLEPPWVPDPNGGAGGAPLVSCVPPGTYALIQHDSAKHPRTFALQNLALGVASSPTPDMRDDVLIHGGNVEADTEGCIVLGCDVGTIGGAEAVLQSAKALAQFRATVPWIEGHMLTILGVDA